MKKKDRGKRLEG